MCKQDMKRFMLVGIIIASLMVSAVAVTNAACTPAATVGDDIIICTGTTLGGIDGDDGDDQITNNGTISNNTSGDIRGGDGNDVIINNGFVGDEIFGNDGNDIIINNGFVVDDLHGGDGDDILINNGLVNDDLRGDDGDDLIINNGVVFGSLNLADGIFGGDGDDVIINNGTVNGRITADDGNDYVIIGNNSFVAGVIFGGSGYDILEFDSATICIGAEGAGEFLEAYLSITGLNPASDSVTLGENTYTWVEFEELITNELWVIFCDGRNEAFDTGTPLVSYCNIFNGLDIYDVNEIGVDGRSTKGLLTIRTTQSEAGDAVRLAISTGQNQLIASDEYGNQLWALSSNELQIMGPENDDPNKTYVFILPSSVCGIN